MSPLPLNASIFFISIFPVIDAYYLSLNVFEWPNARRFCKSHCNSDLASFHSQSQYDEAIATIDKHPSTYKEVWIGLNDIKISDEWQWDDGSTFDFGNNFLDATGAFTGGSYPWDINEPDHNSSDKCVAIRSTQNYQWTDRYYAIHVQSMK